MNHDAERARYRAASEAFDERPSAATRAAILAAAARQVEAGPRDAASPVRPPRRPAAMRWPWAAAATVLLSTLAVMMATQTEREMPTFTPPASAPPVSAPVERAAPAPDSQSQPALVAPPPPAPARSVPASPTSENKQRAAQSAAGNGVGARAERDAPRQDRSTAASPPREAADAASGVASEERFRAKQEAAEQRANEAAASAAPAPATGTLMKRPAPAAKPDGSPTVERQLDERAASVSAPPPVTRAPAAPSSAELGAASDRARDAELSAEDWLKRIVALRASGRHDEADAELKRFRERYPQVQVPPAALPPSGTR
jgi:hypothetical protein